MKSDLFIECAKKVVDIYNITQESIGSKNRMEYPILKEEKKPREWWEVIRTNNLIHSDTFGRYPDYAEAKRKAFDLSKDWDDVEVIKVRELINE